MAASGALFGFHYLDCHFETGDFVRADIDWVRRVDTDDVANFVLLELVLETLRGERYHRGCRTLAPVLEKYIPALALREHKLDGVEEALDGGCGGLG